MKRLYLLFGRRPAAIRSLPITIPEPNQKTRRPICQTTERPRRGDVSVVLVFMTGMQKHRTALESQIDSPKQNGSRKKTGKLRLHEHKASAGTN